MIYATFDTEVLDDPAFQDLCEVNEGHPWRFMRCIQWAKRYNQKGRIARADGVPLDVRALARQHDPLKPDREAIWECFFATCLELGLLVVCPHSGCYQIKHWKRWHRSPSDETEAVTQRKRDQRAREEELKVQLEPPIMPREEPVTPRDPKHVTRGHEPSRNVTDVTRQSRAEQSKAEHVFPEKSACSVQSREEPKNQGSEGGNAGRALMVAGNLTISAIANRYADDIRATFRTFTPRIHEADLLQRTHLDLTKRTSRWDECFTEEDVRLGLSLAVKHADALRQVGHCPNKLVSWMTTLMTTKYVEQAHEWRKMSEKAIKMGYDPLDPPEPDLSDVERIKERMRNNELTHT